MEFHDTALARKDEVGLDTTIEASTPSHLEPSPAESVETAPTIGPDTQSTVVDDHLPEDHEAPSSSRLDESTQMAKDIISEALDADDIISAEIDRVSKEDLDDALEAFSSEETLSEDDRPLTDSEIADEALRELETILGAPDEGMAGLNEDEPEDIEKDLDALDELFAVMAEEEDALK